MHVVFQIESKANSLLCSKFVVIFLVLPSTIVHLFANLLLFAPMTATLMWFVTTAMITNLMWFKYAPIVVVMMLGSIWSSCTSSILCSLFRICSPIFVVANPYSYKLNSCGTYSHSFKVCFDTFFISLASFLEIFFPPLRSIGPPLLLLFPMVLHH